MLTGWGGLGVAVAGPGAGADGDGAAADPHAATIPAPRAPSDRAPPARRRSRRVSDVAGFACVPCVMPASPSPGFESRQRAAAPPHLHRPLRGIPDRLAPREPVGDLADELEDATVEWDPSHARLAQSEACVLDRDRDVAAEDHLEAATDGVAVHRCDHGHVQGAPDREAAESAGTFARPVLDACLACLLRAHVRADAEGALAGAGQDDDPDVTVGLDPRPDLAQLILGRGTQGVEYAGAIDRDTRNVVGELVADLTHRVDLAAMRSSIRSAE